MPATLTDLRTAPPDPWSDDPSAVLSAIAQQVGFDACAIGVINVQAPQIDEFFLAHGWPEPEFISWTQVGFQSDRLLRAALRTGMVVAEPDHPEADSPLTRQRYALSLALAESFNHQRWWWLLLARNAGSFSAVEQQVAGLLLRRWQMRFALPHEPRLRRLLLGHDHRLILADLDTQADLLHQPDMLDEVIAGLPPVVQQRYPDLPDRTTRDLAVNLMGQPWWACFHRARAVEGGRLAQWYLELRPLDSDDIPPLGLVKDDRIAQAVAYIHEHFATSPSLGEIARVVHISPFHFHRLFTRQVGVSPKQYVQKKQLQVAKWLLRKGGVPIGEVAQKTGFSSHGHFTSTFHRVVGASPSEYRDRQ